MRKNRIQLRGITGVAASKTALIELPIGPRYHQVILQHGFSAGTNTIVAAHTNVVTPPHCSSADTAARGMNTSNSWSARSALNPPGRAGAWVVMGAESDRGVGPAQRAGKRVRRIHEGRGRLTPPDSR